MLKILVKYTKNKPKYLNLGFYYHTLSIEYILYYGKFFFDLQFVINLYTLTRGFILYLLIAMKKLYFFIGLALLLQACQNTPVLKNTTSHNHDTLTTSPVKLNQWIINTNPYNTRVALTALKAYENGDTTLLNRCVADSINVYYDGGHYQGGKREFMFAIIEVVKGLKNLRLKVKDCESLISYDKQQERVTTRYIQYWTTAQGLPDSADVIDEARFKNGKITVWYDYMRRYQK